ncbi:unnamed protein product [Spirodela intermedia]|uniref:Uncharacterized protein n=1 Tax=Spirodela intermedia TaxID=51605 RepID=A0A7I8KHZ4_SPIIN|nr:unnamed protein product [Spirodela intermedia]
MEELRPQPQQAAGTASHEDQRQVPETREEKEGKSWPGWPDFRQHRRRPYEEKRAAMATEKKDEGKRPQAVARLIPSKRDSPSLASDPTAKERGQYLWEARAATPPAATSAARLLESCGATPRSHHCRRRPTVELRNLTDGTELLFR